MPSSPQLTPIPTQGSPSSNSTSSSTSTRKSFHTGAIAGAAIGGIAILAFAAGLTWYLIRRRKSCLTSIFPAEAIRLTNQDHKTKNGTSFNTTSDDPNSALSPYKKDLSPSPFSILRTTNFPDAELGTHSEIFQMPTSEDRGVRADEDYFSGVNRMESERRAEMTPQIDGGHVVYELHGSEPMAVEMDDERSRSGLCPMISPSSAGGGVSRASSLGPVSGVL